METLIPSKFYHGLTFCSEIIAQKPKFKTQTKQLLKSYKGKHNIILQKIPQTQSFSNIIAQYLSKYPLRFVFSFYDGLGQLQSWLVNKRKEEIDLVSIITFKKELAEIISIAQSILNAVIINIDNQIQEQMDQNQDMIIKGSLSSIIKFINDVGDYYKQEQLQRNSTLEIQFQVNQNVQINKNNEFNVFFDELRYNLRSPPKTINQMFAERQLILIWLPGIDIFFDQFKKNNSLELLNQSIKFFYYDGVQKIIDALTKKGKNQKFGFLIVGNSQIEKQIIKKKDLAIEIKFICFESFSNRKQSITVLQTNEIKQLQYFFLHLPNNRYKFAKSIQQRVGLYFNGKNQSLKSLAQEAKKRSDQDKKLQIYMYVSLDQVKSNIIRKDEISIIITDQKSNTQKEILKFIEKMEKSHKQKKINMLLFKNTTNKRQDVQNKHLVFLQQNPKYIIKFIKNIHSVQIKKVQAVIKEIRHNSQPLKCLILDEEIMIDEVFYETNHDLEIKNCDMVYKLEYIEEQLKSESEISKKNIYVKLVNNFKNYGLEKINKKIYIKNDEKNIQIMEKNPCEIKQFLQKNKFTSIKLFYQQQDKTLIPQQILQKYDIQLLLWNQISINTQNNQLYYNLKTQKQQKIIQTLNQCKNQQQQTNRKIQIQLQKVQKIEEQQKIKKKKKKLKIGSQPDLGKSVLLGNKPLRQNKINRHKQFSTSISTQKKQNITLKSIIQQQKMEISTQQNLAVLRQRRQFLKILLPVKTLQDQILVFYQQHLNINFTSCQKWLKKYQNQIVAIPYNCKQLKSYINQQKTNRKNNLFIIIVYQHQIQFHQFPQPIWFIQYDNYSINKKNTTNNTHTILYKSQILKQIENYIIHLIYTSFRKLDRKQVNLNSLSKNYSPSYQFSKSNKKIIVSKQAKILKFTTRQKSSSVQRQHIRKRINNIRQKTGKFETKNCDYYGEQ